MLSNSSANIHALIDEALKQELYESAQLMAQFQLSFERDNQSQLQMQLADAAVGLGEDRRAIHLYEQAASHCMDDEAMLADIHFKFARCCFRLQEHALTKQALLNIPSRLHSVPMLLLLARCHEECTEYVFVPEIRQGFLSGVYVEQPYKSTDKS